MNTLIKRSLTPILLGLLPWQAVNAVEIDVSMELEMRAFIDDPSVAGQFDDNVAAALEPDFQGSFNDGNTLWRFTPFGRWDSRDEERRHSDIRELYLLHVMDSWELLAGISKVFWGVAESSHLVDIINQTDYLEGIDGEDKLGQPMLRLSRVIRRKHTDAVRAAGIPRTGISRRRQSPGAAVRGRQ